MATQLGTGWREGRKGARKRTCVQQRRAGDTTPSQPRRVTALDERWMHRMTVCQSMHMMSRAGRVCVNERAAPVCGLVIVFDVAVPCIT